MCRKRFTDKENQDIVKRLCSEMKTLDPTVSPIHVRGKDDNNIVIPPLSNMCLVLMYHIARKFSKN